jgi:hypothetical protein
MFFVSNIGVGNKFRFHFPYFWIIFFNKEKLRKIEI